MRILKKIPAAVGLIFLCFAPQAETIKLAFYQLEPFQMLTGSGNTPGGVTIEYWRTWLAPRMGVDLEVMGPYPISRIQKMLEKGEVDVITHLTRIPERESLFLYPETGLTEISSCLVVPIGSPLKEVRGTEDLYDTTIGFIEDAWIPPMLFHDRIELELIIGEDYRQKNLRKLLAGRLDSMLDINTDSMTYYIRLRGYRDTVRIVPLPAEKVRVYSIFRKSEKGLRLSRAYDEANAAGLARGEFQRLTREYLR